MANKRNFSFQVRNTLELFRQMLEKALPPLRKFFFGLWGLHVLFAVLLIFPPLIIRSVIDQGIAEGNSVLIIYFAFILVAIFGGVGIVDWFRHYLGHKVAQEVTYNLRNRLYWHFQKLSFSFHDDAKVGELLSRLIDDLNLWQSNLT